MSIEDAQNQAFSAIRWLSGEYVVKQMATRLAKTVCLHFATAAILNTICTPAATNSLQLLPMKTSAVHGSDIPQLIVLLSQFLSPVSSVDLHWKKSFLLLNHVQLSTPLCYAQSLITCTLPVLITPCHMFQPCQFELLPIICICVRRR